MVAVQSLRVSWLRAPSDRPYKALVDVYKVNKGKDCQQDFKGKYGLIVFDCHEITVLEDVCEH